MRLRQRAVILWLAAPGVACHGSERASKPGLDADLRSELGKATLPKRVIRGSDEVAPAHAKGASIDSKAPKGGPTGHTALPLVPLGAGRYAYNPHRPLPYSVRGSGHTHVAPDHSGIDAMLQEERLRDLGPGHQHDFVWITAHNFVAPDPGVSQIQHLFGVEVYTRKDARGVSPHVVALLPDGSLADAGAEPFGLYEHDLQDLADAIERAGGLAVLAHPARYSPDERDVIAVDDALWGIEALSGSTKPEDNLRFIDARLSAGKYTCLSAGGDIHAEDYKTTLGYQVVQVSTPTPTAAEIVDQVRACNFFACGTRNTGDAPLESLTLVAVQDEIRFASAGELDEIRFVGRGGKVLKAATSTRTAALRLEGDETYVRVEAIGSEGRARCYSQPVWIIEDGK